MISSYSWIEVSEASRRQAKGWIQRLFGSFFSLGAPQDLTILGGVLVIAYLAIGEHAQLVCNLTTALPAAFFTYQLLTGPTNVSAYKSALTYWTLQASLLLFDHLFNDSSAFFVAKFLILHAVLYHVQRISQQPNEENSSNVDVRPQWDPRITSDDTLASQYMNPFQSATEVTAVQRHKPQQPGGKNVGYATVNFNKIVPAQYRGKQQMPNSFFKETLGSAVSDFSENSMFITPNDGQCRSPVRRQARDALISGYTDAKTANDISASWYNDSHGPSPVRLSAGRSTVASIPRMAADVESLNTVALYDKDIETIPADRIVFHAPFADHATVVVRNVSCKNAMWALKTNATDLIVATPTYGILSSNASMQVKVALREGATVDILRHNDKLAFDYILVSPKQCTFEPQRLLQDNHYKRRKRFHIQYVA